MTKWKTIGVPSRGVAEHICQPEGHRPGEVVEQEEAQFDL